jgi:hypothetical protein
LAVELGFMKRTEPPLAYELGTYMRMIDDSTITIIEKYNLLICYMYWKAWFKKVTHNFSVANQKEDILASAYCYNVRFSY